MENYKYSYEGMSLSQYCTENGISINAIRSKMYRMKQKEEYKHLSDQEIIKIAIESSHSTIKYTYKGIPLIQYCLEHNINIDTIYLRIRYLKKKDKTLTNDQLVTLSLENFKNQNFKYFYKGIPLKEYCEKNDLNYSPLIKYIRKQKRETPSKTDEELIDQYIAKKHKGIYKYYYLGTPLKEYCEKNDLNYKKILQYINRYKKLDEFKDLSDDELVAHCVNKKYKRIYRYFYKGMPLKEYCKENNLNYPNIISYINRYRNTAEFKNLDDNEAVAKLMEQYKPLKDRYTYNGITLKEYCLQTGLPYKNLLESLRKKFKKDELIDKKQIIEESIKKYEKKLEIKEISTIFNRLKNNNISDINEIKNICNFLKINFENVSYLRSKNFSYNQAINIIWYFADRKNANNEKIITDQKLENIFNLITKLQERTIDIDQIEIYDLIGIYKSELADFRNVMLLRIERYICKTIFTLCNSYNIKVNRINYDDFESELKLYYIILLEKINLNNYGQIIKYMDLTMKGYFRDYLKKYNEQNNTLSLNYPKYHEKNSKTLLDEIADSKKQNNTLSNPNIKEALGTLSEENLHFTILRYQEEYSIEELASHFHMTVKEAKEKEIEILSLLKDNTKIKVMQKRRQSNAI